MIHSDTRPKSVGLEVEDLQDKSRFDLLVELRFADLMSFVSDFYWKRRSRVTYVHYAVTLLTAGLWLGAGLLSGTPPIDWLVAWGSGLAVFLLLLPVHEAIHGLVYKYYGARDIRYGILWRQLAAYATAHNFVIDGRRFVWVALMPFLVINALLLFAALALPDLRVLLMATLFWHTSGTSGDFALLNFVWLHRGRNVLTYDDADSKTSYFYAARVSS